LRQRNYSLIHHLAQPIFPLHYFSLGAKLLVMTIERQKFDQLLELFEQVKAKLELVHTPSRDYEIGFPLYKVEIHTIQIIGNNPSINSTDLTSRMGVTKSAVSQTLNKLLKKGLIRKTPLPADARESALELTDLGWKGLHAHERFHTQIYEAVRQHFGESFEIKLNTFGLAMMDLNEILTQYAQKNAYCLKNKPPGNN
jgi:DNA-binding MarR family transcriptional regulator